MGIEIGSEGGRRFRAELGCTEVGGRRHGIGPAVGFQSALDLEPQLADARGNLGHDLRQKGDLATAEKLSIRLSKTIHNIWKAIYNSGCCWPSGGKYPRPSRNYDKAVALDPQDANTLSAVGKAKEEMGQDERSNRFASQKVVALRP